MRRLLTTLLIVEIFLLLAGVLYGDKSLLLSSQIAFLSSTLVIIASFSSYQSMVKERLSLLGGDNQELGFDDRDVVDKIEDPYGVFEEREKDRDENLSAEQLLKLEKERLKEEKRGVKEVVKDMKPTFNIFRLLAYAILVVGFLYLNEKKFLIISIYLLSLSIPIATAIWTLLSQQELSNVKKT